MLQIEAPQPRRAGCSTDEAEQLRGDRAIGAAQAVRDVDHSVHPDQPIDQVERHELLDSLERVDRVGHRPDRASNMRAGSRRPTPAIANTGTSAWRAAAAAASDPAGTNAVRADASASMINPRSAERTATPALRAASGTDSTSRRSSCRAASSASPSTSTSSTSMSPRRRSAPTIWSGQPTSTTVESSGSASANSRAVGSALELGDGQVGLAHGLEAHSNLAHSHHSGAQVTWRSMIRRHAGDHAGRVVTERTQGDRGFLHQHVGWCALRPGHEPETLDRMHSRGVYAWPGRPRPAPARICSP